MELQIIHKGSRITETIFKTENKDQVKVCVMFDETISVCNNITFYKVYIYSKKYKFKTWVFENSSHASDKILLQYVKKEDLYKALYNHWNKLNPFRLFSNGQINSDLIFPEDLQQLEATTNHKAY